MIFYFYFSNSLFWNYFSCIFTARSTGDANIGDVAEWAMAPAAAEPLPPPEWIAVASIKPSNGRPDMNFQQLRIIRETVRKNYNLTEVAGKLYTSQSGVSKHIRDLEGELGVELFIRRGKRLLGLTDPGKELAAIVDRMLVDAANIKKLSQQYADQDEGKLTIATTHTQARYALTGVVQSFMKTFPKVHLALHQGSPPEIADMLMSGQAEIGIATETLALSPQLVAVPYYTWHLGVVVPEGHAVEGSGPLTVATLVEYPIITYHDGFSGRG